MSKPLNCKSYCRTPEKLTRKAGLEVCGWSLCPVLIQERNLVEKGVENKGYLWQNHDASIGATAVGKRHIPG